MNMLRQIPLGAVGLVVGGILSATGFIAYATDNATLNLIGFFYGIPVLLIGLALTASELKPVPFSQPTPPEVLTLREQQATATQNQIRKDVTRYRYGQRAHLDSALEYLGLGPNDEERPLLWSIYEEKRDGAYTLVLDFESSMFTFDEWQQKREKIERFFGPGLRVELVQPGEDLIEMALISTPHTDADPES